VMKCSVPVCCLTTRCKSLSTSKNQSRNASWLKKPHTVGAFCYLSLLYTFCIHS
jgi:hypothetical protein